MSIVDILQFSEEQHPFKPFYGLTVGIVTSIDDPDKLSRVKVKLLNRDISEDETDFIRVMTPMTGQGWGTFFFPEVGDEVLIGFGGGDISRPYVLGSLWNNNYKPPAEINDQKNDIRKIKTRCGHELIFGDEQDKEYIQIITPNQMNIHIDDKNLVIKITDKDEKNIMTIDSNNGSIDIKSEKNLTVSSGNSKITLDGNQNKVSIESSQSLNIKSQQIVIEAQGTMDIKSSGNLNINSSGPANIKGAVVKIN